MSIWTQTLVAICRNMGILDVFMLRPPGKIYLGFGAFKIVLAAMFCTCFCWWHPPSGCPFIALSACSVTPTHMILHHILWFCVIMVLLICIKHRKLLTPYWLLQENSNCDGGDWHCVHTVYKITLWCYDMEMLFTLLALCEGNPPVPGGFPLQKASNTELLCFLGS